MERKLAVKVKEYTITERFFSEKKIKKEVGKEIKIQQSPKFGLASCDLEKKIIYLPFYHPFVTRDLKILAKHEKLHFEITRKAPLFPLEVNLPKARIVSNILEDIIINKELERKELERVMKKIQEVYGGENNLGEITLWEHLSEEERSALIKRNIGKLFKEMDEEDIKQIITETIKRRRKWSSLREFVDKEWETFKRFYDIFLADKNQAEGIFGHYDEGIAKDDSDGFGEYRESYSPPNDTLYKRVSKILRNFVISTEELKKEKKFIGKRVNRRFIENPLLEIHPFIQVEEKITKEKPKVLCLLDCSGSMAGTAEANAKAFIKALMEHADTKVLAHNEYFTYLINSPDVLEKTPMVGDEHFEKLKEDMKIEKIDILLIITDLIISEKEARGLAKFMGRVNARKKYILCVNPSKINNHLDIIREGKRIEIDNQEKVIRLCKKLVQM